MLLVFSEIVDRFEEFQYHFLNIAFDPLSDFLLEFIYNQADEDLVRVFILKVYWYSRHEQILPEIVNKTVNMQRAGGVDRLNNAFLYARERNYHIID